MSQRNQKIKLKKRSRQSARIHRGFAMPVGPGSENSLVSFRDFADLKAKYFRFTGRIQRRPFIFRTLILMFAQFMFSIILYSKIVESILINHMEYAIIFAIIFVLLSIPAVWSRFPWRPPLSRHQQAGPHVRRSFYLLPGQLCPACPGTGYSRYGSSVDHGCVLSGLVYRQGDVRRQCLWPGTAR